MTRWKAKDLATEIAPIIARLLAEELHGRLRPDLLIGDDRVLTEAEAGQILTASERTLEYWRARGIGPRSVKLGERRIGYRLGELRTYVRDAKRGPPGQPSSVRQLPRENAAAGRKPHDRVRATTELMALRLANGHLKKQLRTHPRGAT